jgi:hypothetical protein
VRTDADLRSHLYGQRNDDTTSAISTAVIALQLAVTSVLLSALPLEPAAAAAAVVFMDVAKVWEYEMTGSKTLWRLNAFFDKLFDSKSIVD